MASTSIYGIDYPVNTDLVTNGAAQMQLLATDTDTAINTQVGTLWGRNALHNGSMRFNYRNGQSSFIADRWLTTKSAGATVAWTRTALGVTANLPEYVQAEINGNVTVAGGASDYVTVGQNIESVRTFAGRTVKVTFYAKAAAGTPKLGVSIDQNFGTGGSPSATVTGTGQAVTLSTTYARYTLTFVVASISGKTLGTGGDDFTLLNFWLDAGSTLATRSGTVGNQTGQIYITGVQAETDYVTPLEWRPDGIEEQLLARYFWTTFQQGVYLSAGGVAAAVGEVAFAGSSDGSGFVNMTVHFPTAMFKNPTVTFFTFTAGTLGSFDMLRSGSTATNAVQALAAGNGRKSIAFRTTLTIGAVWVVATMIGHITADTGW